MSAHSLVTEAHVKAVLKADKGNDILLTSWAIEDFTEKGDNLATVVTSVKVMFSHNDSVQRISYVVKLNPCYDGNVTEDITRKSFQKESRFYKELLPALDSELMSAGKKPLRMPAFYYSSLEKGKEMIFLEDLRSKGFKMHNRKEGLNVAHATLVLQEMARLNAASLLLQARTPDEDLADKYSFLKDDWATSTGEEKEKVVKMISGFFGNTYNLLQSIGGYEKCEEWILQNQTKCFDILQEQISRNPPYEVLCHGDCWNNNFLFRYSEEDVPLEVMMVDLQVARVASPATDLNYFLYTSLTGDTRSGHLEDLLATYHQTFSKLMEAGGVATPFTLQELRLEYRNKHKYGLIFASFIVPMVVSDSTDTPEAKEVMNAVLTESMEVWCRKAQQMLASDTTVRKRFLSIFDEMIEAGVFV